MYKTTCLYICGFNKSEAEEFSKEGERLVEEMSPAFLYSLLLLLKQSRSLPFAAFLLMDL